ncbi:MAG: hypothetical protein AB1641_23270 [Thermodesulfobacteriota bacterium]
MTPKKIWSELLQRSPYPYTIPLLPPRSSPLDGTYIKVEVKDTPLVHCRRCPDYAPEAGTWKLNLYQGAFRIFHEATGWKSLGSFIVTRDMDTSMDDQPASATGQLLLANDPACQEVIGVYRWWLEKGRLTLREIDDACAIRLRAINLTKLPWSSCQPPNPEAAITDHWPKPSGCE